MSSMNFLPQDDLDYISKHFESHINSLRKKTILIAGGTGFFGKWLVGTINFLNKKYHLQIDIVLLSRNINNAQLMYQNLEIPIKYLEHDLCSQNTLIYEKSIDYIIHAGNDALWPKTSDEEITQYKSIVGGTEKLLNLALSSGANRFLYVSSGAAIGNYNPNDKSQRVYSESKRMAETLTLAYAGKNKFSASIARCYSFVGPHLPLNKHYAIGNFLKSAFSNSDIQINSDGESIRSYLYAADLSLWLLSILIQSKNESIYDVGSNEEVSIKNLAKIVLTHFPKLNLIIQNNPSTATRYVPSGAHDTQFELQLPTPISLESSIKKTILWHANNKW